MYDWCKPANFPGFPGSLQASSNLPVSRLKHQTWPNLWPLGNTYCGLFQTFSINFVILEMSKRKIKQEVDLVLLFELISIGKRKTEQSNWCIFNEYRSIVQKSANQIVQCMVESWRGFRTLLSTCGKFGRPSGEFQRVFRHCSNWHSYNTKISRHLQILYSGSWQVGWWRNTTDENLYEEAVIKMYVNRLNFISSVHHTGTLCNSPEKTADISRRHYCSLREMTSEERLQKFHTDDTSLPRYG